ncbi:MAG TPA: hypothetical protein VGH19_16040 [Verrucomicrobiae bacterium]
MNVLSLVVLYVAVTSAISSLAVLAIFRCAVSKMHTWEDLRGVAYIIAFMSPLYGWFLWAVLLFVAALGFHDVWRRRKAEAARFVPEQDCWQDISTAPVSRIILVQDAGWDVWVVYQTAPGIWMVCRPDAVNYAARPGDVADFKLWCPMPRLRSI